jgi:hypothetical protein
MDEAASSVMEMFPDITLAFGQSDEFRRVDSDVRNGGIVAEELSRDQFPVQKIDQRLQQATCEGIDNSCIPVYICLCVQLGEIFPWSDLEVPSVVRRQDRPVSHREGSQRLLLVEAG